MKHLICFGDSITAGWDGSSDTRALTDRLEKGLDGWEVRNAGVPGDNTEGALVRLKADVLDDPYDWVTVLFGANDSSFHKGISVRKFRKNMLTIVTAIGSEHALLITPAPVIERKQRGKRTNERIAEYASVVAETAERSGCPLIDLHDRMAKQDDCKDFFQKDGLHFTSKGYDLLSDLIIRTIEKLSRSKDRL
jgi:lysophospholipase L1-like esterase